jgi:hypothetical protein
MAEITFVVRGYRMGSHSGRAVKGMKCLHSLERWDRGFESHSKHGCLCVRLFCVYIVLSR